MEDEVFEELKSRGKKVGLVFLASFLFFFLFSIKTTTLDLPHFSEHTIPYVLPFDYKSSIAVSFFETIRADLVPEFVDPIVTAPAESIKMVLSSSAFLSAAVTIPYATYHGVNFISPALYEKEKRTIEVLSIPMTALFFGGVLFAYFVFLPLAYDFLYSWGQWMGVRTYLSLSSFVSFTGSIMIAMGLSWEMPVFMAGLSRGGVVSHETFKEWRDKVLIGVLIFSAIITPADLFTMVLFAAPLIALYFVGLFVTKHVEGGETP